MDNMETRKSTTEYIFFCLSKPISWTSQSNKPYILQQLNTQKKSVYLNSVIDELIKCNT